MSQISTRTKILRRLTDAYARVHLSVVSLAASALVLLGGAPAYAGQSLKYEFTTMLDSRRDGLEATRCAAINASGTVAVQVRDNAVGISRYVTKRGAHDAPVVVADTQRIADFPTLCDNGFPSFFSNPSINDRGEVAFQANPRRLTTRAECSSLEQTRRRQESSSAMAGRSRRSLTASTRRAVISFQSSASPIRL